MSVIIKLLSKFDDSGLRKAKSGFSGLTKSLGAIGIGFGLKQMTDGLLDAAKAASIDAKSMQLLNNQLVRNANATKAQVTQNNKFIDTLALQVGIADDELRPAQARLARATGSTAKSQELLKLALDASAVSGKPLESVSTALAKAFNGNTTSLKRMFPELSKSKDIIADLTKVVKGAAEEQANPFDRMNVAFGELQEKLGAIVLPAVLGFIDTMMKPGGAIDQAGLFFEAVANPKTDVGQAFKAFGDAVTIAGENLMTLFGMMDPNKQNNPMSGFASSLTWISTTLQTISDGFLVIAGSMQAVSTGNFGEALALMRADTAIAGEALRNNLTVAEQIAKINAETMKTGFGKIIVNDVGGLGDQRDNVIFGRPFVEGGRQPSNAPNITINVQGADPKATVDALGKYLKQNGSLPFNLSTAGRKPVQ